MNRADQILHITLLGHFSATYGEQPVTTINTARMRSLLAYLLLHRDSPLSRQHIAFLFWPDSSESQARTNLRQLLHHLRRAFPQMDRFICATAKTIRWQAETPYILDVAEFEQTVARAMKENSDDAVTACAALETAAQLYRGNLLPECYEEWIEPERERLRQQFITVLDRLVQLLEMQREYKKAIGYARRLVREDDLREASYRSLMNLHALNNDRAAALRVYRTCAKVLGRELEIQPGPEIRALYERLLETPASPLTDTHEQTAKSSAGIPLIDRQKEWEQLRQAWFAAQEKPPHMIWITGEAGIGKTRLAEELLEWVQRQGGTTARTRFYAVEGSLAYAPVADWLRSAHYRTALTSLEDVWFKEIVRILPELQRDRPHLGIPEPLTESWQRQRLFEALARAILTADQPQLLLIDDLQWCDAESLEWLHFLLRFDRESRILIVSTVRSELLNGNMPLVSLMLDLRRGGLLTEIELGRLDAAESILLANQISETKVEGEWSERLFRETEGNPLFVVEMARTGPGRWQGISEEAPAEATVTELPPKMQAVIQYRLLQLSPSAQKLVELAATIGRDFPYDVLQHACDEDEETLVMALDELLQRRIIREQSAQDYDFSHDKIREVAYTAISKVRRRLLHRRVAQAFETIHSADSEAVSGLLAAHFEKAQLPGKAIDYYALAGSVSRRIYANSEAIDYLQKGLALVDGLPEGEARNQTKRTLLLTLTPSLVQGKGYGAYDVHAACAEVHALSQKLQEPTSPSILRTLAIGKLVAGEIATTEALGKELLQQAEHSNDDVVRVEAHYVFGVTYHWQGQFQNARRHLELALDLSKPECHSIHITHYAQDPAVICGIRLALVLWHLGYPHQAQVKAEEALAIAKERSHPFSRSYALHWCAWLHTLRGDARATLQHAKISMDFSTEYQFPYFATQSAILHGWARFEHGEHDAGLKQMREGLAHFRATGSLIGTPYYRGLLAYALAKLGRKEQALTILNEAIEAVGTRKERWPEAELYRFKAKILLLDGEEKTARQAEQAFEKAIDIASRQQARTFALRAACEWKRFGRGEHSKKNADEKIKKIWAWLLNDLPTTDLEEMETIADSWLR